MEGNSPQSWAWKQNGTTVVAAVMILNVVNNWRSALQTNILKKELDFGQVDSTEFAESAESAENYNYIQFFIDKTA